MKSYQISNDDAIFTTILNLVARIEGERLEKLAAQLNADPSCALPDELMERLLKSISDTFDRLDREKKSKDYLS